MRPSRSWRALPASLLLLLAPPALADAPTPEPEDAADDAAPGDEPAGSFTVGAGFDAHEGFVFGTTLAHRRLFGQEGLELTLDARVAALTQDFELRLRTDPWRHDVSFDVGLSASQTALDAGEQAPLAGAYGGHARAGLRLDRHWLLTAGLRVAFETLEHAEVFEATPLPLPPDGLARDRMVAALQLGLDYRSESGSEGDAWRERLEAGLHAEVGTPALGSDLSYLRLEASFGYTLSARWGLRLTLDGRAGALLGDAVSPLSRFRLGHALGVDEALPALGRSVRTATRDVALGGTLFAHGRVELDVPLWRALGLYAYGAYEAGVLGAPDLARAGGDGGRAFGMAPSAGLLWESPIGPLRAGVAFPMDADGPVGDPTFVFSVGGRF